MQVDICAVLSVVLIVILVVLIVCEIVNEYCNTRLLHPKVKHIHKSKYFNNIILSIGMTRCMTLFWPNPNSKINTHTDILLYTVNPIDGTFAWLLMYEDHYKNRAFDDTDTHKYNMYTMITKVHPDIRLKFKLHGYTYSATEMQPTNTKWTVHDVYDVYQELLALPYHRLKFNCHHVVNILLNTVVSNRPQPRLNAFEFDNLTEYKPLLYVYNYVKEKFGMDVVDTIHELRDKVKQHVPTIRLRSDVM